MGRLGDIGDYKIGNCRFITMKQNVLEKIINGGSYRGSKFRGLTADTCSGLASMVKKITGRTKKSHSSIADQAIKISKSFIVTSPLGIVYKDRNVTEFCRIHGLCSVGMSAVCRGVQKHHKGWTGEYINEFSN
jgi:hypothetical protein